MAWKDGTNISQVIIVKIGQRVERSTQGVDKRLKTGEEGL